MSKITKMLNQAAMERKEGSKLHNGKTVSVGLLNADAQRAMNQIDQWGQEFGISHRCEQSSSSRGNGGAGNGNGNGNGSHECAPVAKKIVKTEKITPTQPQDDNTAALDACKRAVEWCRQKLVEAEQQTVIHQREHASLKSQIPIQEQLAAEHTHKLKTLQERFQEVSRARKTATVAKETHAQQMAFLLEHHATLRTEEQALEAVTKSVDSIVAAQRQMTEELNRYRTRQVELIKSTDGLRKRLDYAAAQAVAFSGSVNDIRSHYSITKVKE